MSANVDPLNVAAPVVSAETVDRQSLRRSLPVLPIVASVTLFGLSGYFVYRASTAGAVERGLVAEPGVIELGQIESKPLAARTTVRNASSRVIRIVRVKEHCDCTAAKLSSFELKAGESADLTLNWDVRGDNGPSQSQVELEYNFVTDGATEPQYALPVLLRADVIADITASPKELVFSPSEPESKTVEFLHRSGADFQVIKATANCADLQATVDASGRSVTVTSNPTGNPEHKQGIRGFDVRVDLTSEGTPTIRIPVTWSAYDRLSTSQNRSMP